MDPERSLIAGFRSLFWNGTEKKKKKPHFWKIWICHLMHNFSPLQIYLDDKGRPFGVNQKLSSLFYGMGRVVNT